MGNFYVNYTLRGPGQDEVVAALKGRRARVTPRHKDCVVVYDEASDAQDQKQVAKLAAKLSKKFTCPCLAVLNHDDDILWYQLYLEGKLADEYDSAPDYFSPKENPSGPSGGDAIKMSLVFGGDVPKVEAILRGEYVFAVDRHAELANALGISHYGIGTAYQSFDNDEFPEGLSGDDIVEIGDSSSSESTPAPSAAQQEYQNLVGLFRAAGTDDAQAIQMLVKQLGINPNVSIEPGMTPLHNACRSNALSAAEALLNLGADPNQRYTYNSMSNGTEANRTVLMYAGSAAIVRLLLKHGADHNAEDAIGFTPLMQAAKRRDLESVELLLTAGANPLARAKLSNGGTRNARGFAEAWLQLYEAQSSSPEVLAAIDKAKKVIDRLRLAEQQG